MGDGDDVSGGIRVGKGRDGDGLNHVPGRHTEGQGIGDGYLVRDARRRPHGDIASGHGSQHYRVDAGRALLHGQISRRDGEHRRIDDRHGEGLDGRIGGSGVDVGIRNRPGQGDDPGHRSQGAGQGVGGARIGVGQAVGKGATQDI